MFDDDDFFSEPEKEFDESEEASLEDVMLASLGIQCKYGDIYLKHNKGKKIFNGAVEPAKLAKPFFEYYLDNCDSEMFNAIEWKKLPATLQKLKEKGPRVSDDFGKEGEDDDGVQGYKDLLNERLKLINELKSTIKEKDNDLKKVSGNLIWIVRFMNNKMIFREDVKVNKEEMEILTGIVGATGE